MNIIFLTHPEFERHQSMPRFVKMLSDGMRARGHTVASWSAEPVLYRLSGSPLIQKWLGYIDQYILFARQIRRRASLMPADTLYVFTDQALGILVRSLASRRHVIHCHDFLATRSALNEISENTTSITGKFYQKLILRGLQKGQNFICVSKKTREDLLRFLRHPPKTANVIYNGFHQPFFPIPKQEARIQLSQLLNAPVTSGYLLHIGGNQWYKNRKGVIEIYDAWRAKTGKSLILLMIGDEPDQGLQQRRNRSPFCDDIYCMSNVSDTAIRLAYAGASLFIFPSLGEGFGWPIAEAMASGTIVINTNEPPMTEVAGDAGYLIPRMPQNATALSQWASAAADVVETISTLDASTEAQVVARGLETTKRFDTKETLDAIENIYKAIAAQIIP